MTRQRYGHKRALIAINGKIGTEFPRCGKGAVACGPRLQDFPGYPPTQTTANMPSKPIDRISLLDASASHCDSLFVVSSGYRLLLNPSAAALVEVNLNGGRLFCTPACIKILGGMPKVGTERNIHHPIHHTGPDGTPCPWQAHRTRTPLLNHVVDEIRWRANRTQFPVEYWPYSMICGPGGLAGGVITLADFSAGTRAERVIPQSEERYREFFENATYGIFLSRRDGSLVDANPAFVRMLGYDFKEELLARNLAHDIYDDPAARQAILDGCDSSAGVDCVETTWKRKDGERIYVRLSANIIHDANGSVDHYQVIAEDVTERRITEDRLRQAEKMEAFRQVAGGVAHDCNNVLGVIMGNLELLAERVPPDELSEKYIQQIQLAVNRGTDITRQLLAFSRKQILQPVLMNLNKSIEQFHELLHRLIGEHIRVSLALDHTLGAVKADPGQVEQILVNLVLNARDAMPTGGSLQISTSNILLDERFVEDHSGSKSGEYSRIRIADSGCGMTADVLAKVFEPFFTTKRVSRRNGLGLATVYGIVNQSLGYLCIRSQPEVGTVVDVYFPHADEQEARQSSKNAPGLAWGSETVLLVEDNEALRKSTAAQLTKLGYRVLDVGSPELAIGQFEVYTNEVDLLLTDLVMPGMNGRTLAQTLSKKKPALGILYMSGYSGDEILRPELDRQDHEILMKPFTKEKLAECVRRAMDRACQLTGDQSGVAVGVTTKPNA